jgi:hypothetical protein
VQPDVFCAFAAAFKQASAAREPSHRRGGLASEDKARPDKEGVPSGAPRIAAADGFMVSPCPRPSGFSVMAGQHLLCVLMD